MCLIAICNFFSGLTRKVFDGIFVHQVADVSEVVHQYADAMMLSGESAVGSHGQKALSVLQTVSTRMERWNREGKQERTVFQRNLRALLSDRIAEAICTSAVDMGIDLSLKTKLTIPEKLSTY